MNSVSSEVTMTTSPHTSSTVCLNMIAGNIHFVSLTFKEVQCLVNMLGFMFSISESLNIQFVIMWSSSPSITNANLFPFVCVCVCVCVCVSPSPLQSFKNLVAKKKRLVVLFSHWLLHAYGIISISRLDKLEQDLPLLALVPGPALFYIATAKFTEPSRILSEGGNGHWQIHHQWHSTKRLTAVCFWAVLGDLALK